MPSKPRKIKIQSDGTGHGTRVFLDDEDIRLPITDIQLVIDQSGVQATFTIVVPELDLTIDEDQARWVFERFPKPKEVARFFSEKQK